MTAPAWESFPEVNRVLAGRLLALLVERIVPILEAELEEASQVGRPHGQRRIAAAADELQRLRDEFDFADAARSELHMPGELAPLDVAAHFGVQAAHRIERGVVLPDLSTTFRCININSQNL